MNKILFTLLLGLAISVPSMAGAIPAFPMNFWGTVTIDGDNAPIGTVIGAYDASDTLIAQFTVTTAGAYGSEDRTVAESAKLSISDYSSAGTGLTFKLNSPSYDNNAILADTEEYAGAFQAEYHQNQNLVFTGANPNTSVTAISVTPTSASVVAGNTQQFTATATYYDATTADITTSCTWSSSASAATIGTNTGLATGSSAGSTTITASYTDATNGVLTDTSALTVTAAASGGGGGGGSAPSAPAMPTTTDGDVTATRASGGMTTISVSGGGTASIKVPAYAVTANTKVSVEAVATTEEGLGEDAFAIMTGGYTIVGDYVYEITASAGGDDVTEFSKKFTITLTYTDAQIAGLSETSLTISYWDADEEKWFALPTTLDKDTNTLTAKTDHLTYFAILSGIGKSVDIGKPASQMTQAELRAAILNILTQIKELQAILAEMRGAPGRVRGCVISSFNRTLKAGMSGDDVKCMQIILNSSPDTQIADSGPGSPGNETNYFGQLTKAAAVKFQEKHMNEVLKPHGLNKGTGFVGKTTRAKLNKLLK